MVKWRDNYAALARTRRGNISKLVEIYHQLGFSGQGQHPSVAKTLTNSFVTMRKTSKNCRSPKPRKGASSGGGGGVGWGWRLSATSPFVIWELQVTETPLPNHLRKFFFFQVGFFHRSGDSYITRPPRRQPGCRGPHLSCTEL